MEPTERLYRRPKNLTLRAEILSLRQWVEDGGLASGVNFLRLDPWQRLMLLDLLDMALKAPDIAAE
jgi:hypothetical protein